jgi:hypothetical protein
MIVFAILQHMYPGMSGYYEVLDNEISMWDESVLGTRPTDTQLADNWIDALRHLKRREMRRAAFAEMDTHLMDGYPERDLIFIILDKAQGINDPRLPTLADIRKRLKDKEAYIRDPARTQAELEAVSW